ncbi:LOW QUALITY PROTEIN: E3 ubiquitin-protein ligase RNF213 [Rhynchonycteris naso]
MECPWCGHVSKEEAPKFCSECGQRLPPAAPAPAPDNPKLIPEGEMESGKELKETSSPFSYLGSSDWQEILDKPCSQNTWKVQKGVAPEVFVDAVACTSDELKANYPPSKRRKEDPTLVEVADVFSADPEQSKRKRKKERKNQNTSVFTGLESLPPCPSILSSLDSLVYTEFQEAAVFQSPAQQGGPTNYWMGITGITWLLGIKRRSRRTRELISLSPGEGVTVIFHAIISKDFHFDSNHHKVFVRGEELGKPKWNCNVCELYAIKPLDPHGFLVEGSTVISKQHLGTPIPYKYVVAQGSGSVQYEFIYKRQQKEKDYVNCCLHMKSSLLGSGGTCLELSSTEYNSLLVLLFPFLGLIHSVPDSQEQPSGQSVQIRAVMNHFVDQTRKDVVKGKHLAANIMLDGIFSILHSWKDIDLKKFFSQFRQFYFVVHMPMIYEGQEQPWSDLQYGEKEVKEHLCDYLSKKMTPFLESGGDHQPADCPVKSKLRMGLIVLHLVQEFKLPLSLPNLTSLCTLLCSNASSPGDLHADLSHIFATSQSAALEMLCSGPHRALNWRVYLVNLCQMSMDRGIDHWVGILPVLHHCMGQSPRGMNSGIQHEDTWAALEGISFSEFREKRAHDRKLLDFMKKKKRHLLHLDEHLFRSWFSVLPLSKLAPYLKEFSGYLSDFPACVLDCFWGTCYRLQGLKEISNGNLENTDNILKMLLHLLDTFQDKVLKEASIQPYLTVCLKLHGNVCRLSKDYAFYEMPASSAEIMCRIVRLVDLVDGQGSETGKKNLVRTAVQRTLATTREWLRGIFKNSMFLSSRFAPVTFTYKEEIQVWRQLVEINFPEEHGWKESLLGDIEGRLKQEKPLCQIFVFCNTNWEAAGSGDSVSKCFENCVVEAVSSVCQSQTSILDGISYSDLHKFGTLVSTVITKSWPRNCGEAVDDLEEVLKHLLMGPDIKHLFKLYERKNLLPQAKEHNMRKVLDHRLDELLFLQKEREYVNSLLRLCKGVKHWIKVEFGEIAEKHSEDLSNKRLKDIVMMNLFLISSDSTWVTHYNIDSLKDSHILQIFWAEATKAVSQQQEEQEGLVVGIEDKYEDLYLLCFNKFNKLYKDLKAGEVTFAEVDTTFKVFVNKYDDLTTDLRVMCALDPRDKDWIQERVRQICEYHHLYQAAKLAKVILNVKENLSLTGDFDVLLILLLITDNFESFRHEKLDQINEQLIWAYQLLQGIDEARYQCLQELSLRKEFIIWVQEALGGINDLKVFVDLASISAGENDIDVDRVACFHDAVQGYPSLLHKLDTSAGFHEFMDHLKELWKALENDPALPSKLHDSARNLEWLKTVKESHGSVELSSLLLATAINSRGTYMIQVPGDGQKISPDMVLHLRLPERHGDLQQLRKYSLEELKELLNKLMLMSGKKDHNSAEVEQFSEVFCNIQRLTQSFINLYCAGNLLFRAWKAEVYCSPRKDISVQMDFSLGLGLLGTLAGNGLLAPLLEAICRQMELFLEQWERFMAQKRAHHFHLNYYTAEQLVYLSTELVRQPPSDAALTMLSFIKCNCTPQDIAEACVRSESRAARHLQQTTVEELRFMLSCESSVVDKLGIIMKQSLVCTSAFLPHCLDLETLGCCLAQLARMGEPSVMRELPKGLQAGQLNLIVSGHVEVLLAALATYMQTPKQPLPTYDEVLLCTPGTTFEEVALLLRCCLSRGSQRRHIYSLLYADQLSYEVACQAEALFHSLCTQPHWEDYQLIMVCDCEREHCHLPSVFSQHKAHIPQAPLEVVQAYLAHHFRVPEWKPLATAMFKDQMCVGIVASERAGVGKSLYMKLLHETLKKKSSGKQVSLKTIQLINPQVDESQVLGSLLPLLHAQPQTTPMIFHFDVTTSVQTGIWAILFKLLILQYLMDINGKMWLRNPCHLYVIEILERCLALPLRSSKLRTSAPHFSFLDIFPKVTCRPPKEVLDMELNPQWNQEEPGMDPTEFCSETFQRPFQYLKRFYQKQNLDMFQYEEGMVEGTPAECLQHLLFYCGVINPFWSELWNFAWFLNYQLRDYESSQFCNPRIVGDTLRGFKNFVVTFMIFMARDFATPTLHTSDQSPGKHIVTMGGVKEEDITPFSLRRKWESEPHPYVFFNNDHTSMTFIGFHLQPNENGMIDAIDHLSKKVIKNDIMTIDLYQGLLLQRVPFSVDFDELPRYEKLERFCLALGIQPIDPDDTYELITDNVLKILAIEMRFRCGIPVIIMGETGCGKTRLIKFLSDLRRGCTDAETMKLVKVHGGTSANMIYDKVKDVEVLALANTSYQLDTVLFFDEANTTEAINCIKEVLCDHTVDSRLLVEDSGLHIIAACNPYRKHSQEMISRLEAAGLGYRVSAEETADRLGSIPLRQPVYRVHALPPSLIPLVWDFGQLSDTTEKLYIQQIIQRLVDATQIGQDEMLVITDVLSASQRFMRKRRNECSFVSLRDVERCVKVFRWFYDHSKMLLSKLNTFLCASDTNRNNFERDPSLVLAIGVCYHASLEKQELYRKAVCQFLPQPYSDSKAVLDEILRTQDLFLDGVALRKTIAKNLALKENVFMMVICIELKIPLFLVGKPSSSKSLAKTIVADAMQVQASHSDLFWSLKQVHLVSFQCSPHSTPQGIISTFRQCARFQQGKDLQQYVSVVVLDEVGLAEDSPKMPLKALHPLLEDGCIEDDDPAPHKKVGFIGISNWALDPAKMNWGIFVSRGSPNKKELVESARGICSSEPLIQERIQGYFPSFAKTYERVCKKQDKEFFGLRDYYSLIKMVFASAKASNKKPSSQAISQAILRNFSGKDDIHALDIFTASLPEAKLSKKVSTVQLIRDNVYGDLLKVSGREPGDSESRHLIVLTKNYVALQILQWTLFHGNQQPEIIFGSSFPRDQEYTQICRNINRVKICMETGKMVVLFNLQNLYESLYDALNQYYVYLGGQKYVDLGLGTHRVKCRVHPDFRLIVIEEKDVVYKHFPIPLINRLEKHYLDINTILEKQKNIVEELQGWVKKFICVKEELFQARHSYSPSDVFIGYHSDTCASVVLQVIERLGPRTSTDEHYQKVLEDAKLVLLDCATPDAMVRLSSSSLGIFVTQSLLQEYYYRQQHDSFADFLQAHLRTQNLEHHVVFTGITTFSRLLTSHDRESLEAKVNGRALKPTILSLQQFDTEYSFLKEIRNCLTNTAPYTILIIQTDFEDGVQSAQLVASAKYSVLNEINKVQGNKDCIFVYLITKLSRMGSGTSYVGFHGGLWHSVHIDDLQKSTVMVSDVTKLKNVTISQLFKPDDGPVSETEHRAGDSHEEVMETETDELSAETHMDMETDRNLRTRRGRHWLTWHCLPPCCRRITRRGVHEPASVRQMPALDTNSLLRSCIQSTVGLLHDLGRRSQRNMRWVEILLGLLSEDDEPRAAFLRVTKMHLHDLLTQQEQSYMSHRKEWVMQEASNPDALQEARSVTKANFGLTTCYLPRCRHTLWKRVQGAVTPLLASIVSVIDRDGNLELLATPDTPSWARDLWMFIFRDIKLLNIPVVINDTRSKNEMSHILVQSHMNLLDNVCNAFPFSWRIRDYLEELWVQAQYISEAAEPYGILPGCLSHAKWSGHWGIQLVCRDLPKTPLGCFLTQLHMEERQELLNCYLKDFLLLTMRLSTSEELTFPRTALWSCVHQLTAGSPKKELSLPWVHLAYQHFRIWLQNFSRILTLYPPSLDSLTRATQSHSWAGHEMTLDAFAAMACTELLTRDLLKPGPKAWLQTVKNLSIPLELLCSDGYVQDHRGIARDIIREVRNLWNRISSVALFVVHVLLGTRSCMPVLDKLVTKYVFLLDKYLQENSDIKTHKPFMAVMTALYECKEEASRMFTRRVQPCPICLGDAQDPACLPCEHVFCLCCVRSWLIPGQMRCPLCLTDLPDSFSLKGSHKHRDATEKHLRFRQMCTSFFVDLVSTMCFKGNCPPHKDVVEALLSLLFVQKNLLRNELQPDLNELQRCREHTKSLSPFDDVMDKMPVIRSLVLKLLLKYSFHEVKDYIQDHSQLEKKAFIGEDKTELYILVSRCLEDSIHEKNSSFPTSDDLRFLREDGQACLSGRHHREPACEASVEYLQEMVRIHICLDRASEVLSELQEGLGKFFLCTFLLLGSETPLTEKFGKCERLVLRVTLAPFPSSRCFTPSPYFTSFMSVPLNDNTLSPALTTFSLVSAEMAKEKQQFLQQVKHFCTQVQNDWYWVYLVRKLTSLQGIEFVQFLSRPGHPAQWVFPKEVIAQQKDCPGQMDRYLVHGEEYKAVRDAVDKVALECPLAFVAALEACTSSQTQQAVYLLLALFREVTTLYQSCNASLHPKPEQCEAMNKFIEERQTLSPAMRGFATSLVANTLPLLRTDLGDSGPEGTVTEMAVHAAAILLCGQNRVLEPLKNLAFSPATMVTAYLPTMLKDLQAQARNWQGLEHVRWYMCPNGHQCCVGECGMPMEQSVCIDCGAPIGGKDHRPTQGFTVIQENPDRTQTGHMLGSPTSSSQPVVSDRQLSPVAFLLARLLTHLAMLLGAAHSQQGLSHIIKPEVRDPRGFLQQHLHKDLQQLMKTLGKSADDTAIVVHLVLRRLCKEQHPLSGQSSSNFDATLSTKGKRNSWERSLETLILPELENLDKSLLVVNTLISYDEHVSSSPVARIIFGDPVAILPHLPCHSVVHCSKMWSCRTRISVECLQHIVEQKNGKVTVPILWKFLQKEAELRLVKFLPEILALQRDLVKQFQNTSEAEYQSIRGFVNSHGSDGLKRLLLCRVMVFLATWNKLRRSLETNGEIKLPKNYCSADLDLDAEFEIILPRRQGLGLCSTALVSYLISLHNEIDYMVEKFSNENSSYSVDASEIADLHVINYEVERDLTPLILSNCQYKVEEGGKNLQEFDLEKIQRQVTSQFLQGKPKLTLKGIPPLVYRRDWNYEQLFKGIRNKMLQSSLPNMAISAISRQLQSYSDTCEALPVIEVTLGFLSTTDEDPNMDLNVYIQDKLRMGDQTEQVLEAFHRCQLRHVLALCRFLCTLKSEQLLRLRKEPFGDISGKYKDELSLENSKLLSTFLNQTSLGAFLLELHEMMVLKLKTKSDFNPNWSLRDTLVSYMDTKGSEIPPEMDQFPEEILLSNCVSVWKMVANLKRDRQMR